MSLSKLHARNVEGFHFVGDECMTKGKPWTVEEERRLSNLVEARASLDSMAKELNRSPDAVLKKCVRLGLRVVVAGRRIQTTTSSLVIPKDLPSVEDALRMLAGGLRAACASGLDRVEVQRLQVLSNLARTYQEILANYLDYRGVEAELREMRNKYAELSGKTSYVET